LGDPFDELVNATVNRISWRLHPLITQHNGFRSQLLLTDGLLKEWKPAHVISTSNAGYCVDGLRLSTKLKQEQMIVAAHTALESFINSVAFRKYENILSMVEAGETVFSYPEEREMGRCRLARVIIYTENPEAMMHPQGKACVHFIVAFKQNFDRFAIAVNYVRPDMHCYLPPKQDGFVPLTCAANQGKRFSSTFPVRERFFNSPSDRNVRLLGELILLAQARKEWSLPIRVQLLTYDEGEFLTNIHLAIAGELLKGTVGAESLTKHFGVELLLEDPKTLRKWQSLAGGTSALDLRSP